MCAQLGIQNCEMAHLTSSRAGLAINLSSSSTNKKERENAKAAARRGQEGRVVQSVGIRAIYDAKQSLDPRGRRAPGRGENK